MKIQETKYIKYEKNGKAVSAWTGTNPDMSKFTNITSIEIRPMLVAEDGLVLYKGDEEIGSSIWLKDDDSQENYTEGEPKPIEEEHLEHKEA